MCSPPGAALHLVHCALTQQLVKWHGNRDGSGVSLLRSHDVTSVGPIEGSKGPAMNGSVITVQSRKLHAAGGQLQTALVTG